MIVHSLYRVIVMLTVALTPLLIWLAPMMLLTLCLFSLYIIANRHPFHRESMVLQ